MPPTIETLSGRNEKSIKKRPYMGYGGNGYRLQQQQPTSVQHPNTKVNLVWYNDILMGPACGLNSSEPKRLWAMANKHKGTRDE